MYKIRQMLKALEKELRNEKQYSAADKLLPIIEEAGKDGWIPCNKDLPQKSGRYLAIVTFGKNKFQIVEILVFKKDRNRWFRQGRGNEVIAWRELPEPYKGE